MKKNCLIIGFGSIGFRHARVLTLMGCAVYVVSKRKVDGYDSFTSVQKALESVQYQYAVICRPTADHYRTALDLRNHGFDGKLLIEKPLFEKSGYPSLHPLKIFVGYNLRFHPILKKIFNIIKGVPLYSMHVYCGQYLPQWRENRDYRTTYSASEISGGGVLKDLSHELDYICRLAGPWQRVAAKGGRVSDLEIDTDDVFGLLLETAACPLVTVQLNYLDLKVKREMIVNGKDLSIKADLIKGILDINGETSVFQVEKDATYRDQHENILSGGTQVACTYHEGLAVLNLIEAAKRAAKEGTWIKRN